MMRLLRLGAVAATFAALSLRGDETPPFWQPLDFSNRAIVQPSTATGVLGSEFQSSGNMFAESFGITFWSTELKGFQLILM